jgi:ribonuclease BN (tRNA processing enzyme)
MKLRVVGCHGGETPKHRTSAFVLDDRLAIDAGSLTSGLDLSAQMRLEACVVSHAHLDHIRDLATIADNRCQQGAAPLLIAAPRATIRVLKKHFFNDHLWPDFSKISAGSGPTIQYQELALERATTIAGYEVTAIGVSHTVDTAGFLIRSAEGTLAYSGDTGPTDRFWELLNQVNDLKGLLAEVSFPDEQQGLATASGHHTPRTLAADLAKLSDAQAVPTLLYHIKPFFQADVERQCARLKRVNMTVPQLDELFSF